MPAPTGKHLFEFRGQWIAPLYPDDENPTLYRFWRDKEAGRTRRETLRTSDLEEAKEAFLEAIQQTEPKTDKTPLSLVFKTYCEQVTDAKPSGRNTRAACRVLLGFWGETVLAGEVDLENQKKYAQWAAAQNQSAGYISRNLAVLSAALKHSKIRAEVIFNKKTIAKAFNLKITKAKRKAFIPDDAELLRFLSLKMPEPLFRWCVMALLTVGRPEAVLELTPGARRRNVCAIHLNPEGRVQNNKYRPVVRVPKALDGWLDLWERDMRAEKAKRLRIAIEDVDISGDRYCPYASRNSVQSALERWTAKAKLPKLSAYSFRHKAKTVLQWAGVPTDEIAWQMGHKRPDLETTMEYGEDPEYAPAYLKLACAALDAWWAELCKSVPHLESQKSLKLHSRPGGLRVVKMSANAV